MSESSVIEELVEQIKQKKSKASRSSRGGKSSRSSKSHKSQRNYSNSDTNTGKKKKGLFGGILGSLGKNKMFIIGLAVLLVLGIGYYLMKKKKPTSKKVSKKNNELNENHMNKVKEILNKREAYDKENNIVRIKLPERYLTDESGKPVVLTPEIVQSIKKQPVQVNKEQQQQQQQRQQPQQQQHQHQHQQKHRQQINNISEESDEDDNVNLQNLTKAEMDDIKNQLEMMDTNIVPSNQ
jgi:hypothetical protein